MEPKRLTADRFVDGRTGCSYRYVRSETEYFRPHDHDYYELFLVLDGVAHHVVNGRRFDLPVGSLVLVRPHDLHDYERAPGAAFGFVNLSFYPELFDRVAAFTGDGFPAEALRTAAQPPTVHLTGRAFRALKCQMEALCVLSDDRVSQLRFRMRTLLFDILTRYFGEYTADRTEPVPQWLAETCRKMQQDGNFRGGIARMAELSGKSREHLTRSIRRYYHQSASAFINEMRLTYFANMLRNSRYPILELCYDSGFQNVSWAYAQFRCKYGMTPKQYRESG